MPASRCTLCSLNFPEALAGEPCPVCELDTLDYAQNAEPDDPDELRSMVTHARFERYLEAEGRV